MAALPLPTDRFVILGEIRDALRESYPIVALESVVISHGLPYPTNRELARDMETAVRDSGAVPATVALLDGRVHVGLTDAELERLSAGGDLRKCSVRDLPIAMGLGLTGGTTVAATAYLAHALGIRVFATGGIGGVHPGIGERLDISADLPTLGRIPVVVVSSGAKSILDLQNTLEVLETLSVPVLGFGTDTLPGFHTRSTGLPVDVRVTTPAEVASIDRARQALGLQSALLVAQPVPEEDAVPASVVDEASRKATAKAHAAGIAGREVTPYVLSALNEDEDPRFLRANLSLLKNNARLGGRIAVEMARA